VAAAIPDPAGEPLRSPACAPAAPEVHEAVNPKSILNLVAEESEDAHEAPQARAGARARQRTSREAPLAEPAPSPDAPRTRKDGKLGKRLKVARKAATVADPEQPLHAVWASMVELAEKEVEEDEDDRPPARRRRPPARKDAPEAPPARRGLRTARKDAPLTALAPSPKKRSRTRKDGHLDKRYKAGGNYSGTRDRFRLPADREIARLQQDPTRLLLPQRAFAGTVREILRDLAAERGRPEPARDPPEPVPEVRFSRAAMQGLQLCSEFFLTQCFVRTALVGEARGCHTVSVSLRPILWREGRRLVGAASKHTGTLAGPAVRHRSDFQMWDVLGEVTDGRTLAEGRAGRR
jgi:histone H3/H4